MSFIDSTGQTIDAHSLGVQPIKSLSAVSALGAGTALDGVVSCAKAVATKIDHQFGRFRPAAWFWRAAWMAPTSSPSAGLIDAVGAYADVGVGAGAGVCFGSGLVNRGGVARWGMER